MTEQTSPALSHLDLVFAFHRLTWAASRPPGIVYTQARVADLLVERAPMRRTVIADHPSSGPVAMGRRLTGRGRPFPERADVTLVSPRRIRRQDPGRSRSVVRTYERYSRTLGRAAADLGFHQPPLLTTNPFLAAYGRLEWAGTVTHFATDDFSVGNRWSVHYSEAYAKIAEKGLPVAAVSRPLLDRIRTPGRTLVVPNGVDPGEWDDRPPAPDWFLDLPRPRMIYVGVLMSRLDIDIVHRVADEFPGGSIVLVGNMADAEHLASLRRHSNVTVHPAVDRAAVRGIMGEADVGLVPHVVNAMTRSMSPLKVYEYLAAGLPVVSTPLPGLDCLASHVLIRAPRSFVNGVREALGLGRQANDERRQFVSEHSWQTGVLELLRFAVEKSPATLT